jgi:hypothetical protein
MAAEKFRMAVAASPEAVPPRFAFGQALVALGDFPYAARVLREALAREPAIVGAPGAISGVYKDAEEFERVKTALGAALAKEPLSADLLFLVLYEQHFSGDPLAMETLEKLEKAHPADPVLPTMAPGVRNRFKALDEFPPSEKQADAPAVEETPTKEENSAEK